MTLLLTKENLNQLHASYEENGRKMRKIGPGFLFDYAKDRDSKLQATRDKIEEWIAMYIEHPGIVSTGHFITVLKQLLEEELK